MEAKYTADQQITVEFRGETCYYLPEDSHLQLDIANRALIGLHALLLDSKTAKTRSFGVQDIADIIGCISEKLAVAMNETNEFNHIR